MLFRSEGQQVLIVTYLNAGVENFKAQVRRWLQQMDLPLMGFDVRTLHSLGLEIVRTAQGSQDETNELLVLDDTHSGNLLRTAVNSWIDDHPQLWHAFLPDDSLQMKARWREITERTARVYIRAAKNARYRPETIQQRLT